MELDASTRTGRSASTWTLLGLTTLLTALPTVSAVRSVLTAAGVIDAEPSGVRGGLIGFGLVSDERSVRVAEGFAAVVSVPVALTALIVLLGLVRWKEWAREAALGVFGLVGLLLLLFSLNGLSQGGPRAGVGVAGSLAVLAVAGLALAPGVRDDFERRRLQKARREREAAAAERRAREGAPQSRP
jgi:hypothetical protein